MKDLLKNLNESTHYFKCQFSHYPHIKDQIVDNEYAIYKTNLDMMDIGEMLHQIREYFDQRADADYGTEPNEEMILMGKVIAVMDYLNITREND